MECCGVLSTTQFVYRKGLGTCDVCSCLTHTQKNALEGGQEARILQIDFSAAFDRVSQHGIFNKVFEVLFSRLTQFLSNR